MSDNSCDDAGTPVGDDTGGGSGGGGRVRRRRFLSFLGGGGLAAAGALFGVTASAEAAGGCGCCNLVYCPANTSISSCRSVSHYLWGCSMSASLHCSCCEKKRSNGSYYASAYSCQYN